jgi:hypothetical protein
MAFSPVKIKPVEASNQNQRRTIQSTRAVKSPYTPPGNYEHRRGLEWLWALNGTYKNPPIKKVE